MRSSLLVALVAVVGFGAACDTSDPLSVVVFTRENLYVHPSNPVAAETLASLGDARGWQIKVTDDPAVFTESRLRDTDVVVFSVTSGPILDDPARAALETFFRRGGGFVGTHSASITEQDWPLYKELVPATFKTHPQNPNERAGTLTIENPTHPLVEGLPSPWMRTDEFYTFYERPEDFDLDILLALDEASLGPDYMLGVGYHPLAWTHEHVGNRTFYTALGHTPESYAEPEFMGMLERGIVWAANR